MVRIDALRVNLSLPVVSNVGRISDSAIRRKMVHDASLMHPTLLHLPNRDKHPYDIASVLCCNAVQKYDVFLLSYTNTFG